MPELLHKWLEAIDTLLAKHRYMKKTLKGSYKKDEIDQFVLNMSKDIKEAERLFSGILLNLATPEIDCDFCSALRQRESDIREKFINCFNDIHQCLVYDHGELGNIERLEQLGNYLFVG